MAQQGSIERRALEALERLVSKQPTNPILKTKLLAGNRIVSVSSVAIEAGVNRGSFGSASSRLPHVWEEIRKAADLEAKLGLGEELRRARAEITRLREQLHKSDVYNASLQLELSRVEKRSHHGDGIVSFRRDRRKVER